jgi:isopentenyl-diphosphate delta-isomerase
MELKDLTVALPSYCYTTPPFKGVIENEFCPVFLARQATAPKPNPEEVENLDWLDWEEFMRRVEADDSDVWSYWCKDQVKQLTKLPLLKTYIS